MTMSVDERAALIAQKTKKAHTALEEALGNIAMQYWDTAANRLYYALFHSAEALFAKAGLTANTHSGAVHLLAEHFVLTGLLSKEEGRLYSKVYNLRQDGDYGEWDSVSGEDVMACVEPVKAFIAKAKALLDE